MKVLYRYKIQYSSADDPDTKVELVKLPVLRETDHTYFIGHQYQTSEAFGKKLKRVLKLETFANGYQQTGKLTKRFAYLNKTDAMLDFKRRTRRRIDWFEYWKKECERALEIVSNNELIEEKK